MRTFDEGEMCRRVDEILFYVWDPIGVSPEPCARAEYEGYVPKVLQLLEENDSPNLISEHLLAVMRVDMGLSPDKERCDKAAEMLLAHKDAIKEGLA
jgi:hypothetical protein